MIRPNLAFLPLVLTLACAHGSGASRGDEVLERGGELADVQAELQTVTITNGVVTVWGMTEVPDGSRLQMAFAGVDAITRSELVKVVQVRVAEVITDVDSTDPGRRSITAETMELVDGVVASAGPLPHGWARVRRGDEIKLRLWARLDIKRAALETAVRSLLESHGKTYSPSLLDGLGKPADPASAKP